MTDIVTPPTIDAMPAAPQPTDTPEAFSAKAFATAAAQTLMVTQTNASAAATQQNATAANERAATAQQARTDSLLALEDAVQAASDAAAQAAIAVAAAQAALAGAGIPAPSPNRVYATDGSSAPAWRDLSAMTALQAKADKDGAVVTRMSTNRQPYTPAAGATQALDVSLAGEFQVTAAGALTLTFSNVPAGNVSFVLTLDCVNFGGKVISWPAGNWIKADGSYATAVGNAGVTWQTAGTDTVLVWFKNGVPHYKVLR